MKTRAIVAMAAVLVVAGAAYVIFGRPDPAPVLEPPPYVWKVEMLELDRVAIALPRAGKAESWVRHEDKYWYFDLPDGPQVSRHRWGGGIPAILSGPRSTRVITRDATDEQLALYGLIDPRMTISLGTETGDEIDVEVGDATPTGQNYYIKRVGSRDVFSVDYTWYDVLERLVNEPPYPGSGE
jgi:uncharacterized protein DUF4340